MWVLLLYIEGFSSRTRRRRCFLHTYLPLFVCDFSVATRYSPSRSHITSLHLTSPHLLLALCYVTPFTCVNSQSLPISSITTIQSVIFHSDPPLRPSIFGPVLFHIPHSTFYIPHKPHIEHSPSAPFPKRKERKKWQHSPRTSPSSPRAPQPKCEEPSPMAAAEPATSAVHPRTSSLPASTLPP